MIPNKCILSALVSATGLLVSIPSVHAQNACPTSQIACSDTKWLPNPIYLAGSSAFEPILKLLAVRIQNKQGVSIIYSPISSCSGISSIYGDPSLTGSTAPQVLTTTPRYYVVDPTDSTKATYCSCTLSGNTYASIGVSDVSFESCQGVSKPDSLGEWLGPEQAMLFVVPEADVTTTAISAEQAGVVFGCGQQGNFSPFLSDDGIQERTSTSGTQIMIGKNIGAPNASGGYTTVPETAFKGTSNSSSSALLTALLAWPNPQSAIGILANDVYATNRSVLNSLAFRGFGQTKAYYADSDAIADDLLNVREGRYMIQGPLHLFAPLTSGAPTAAAANVLNWLTGAATIDASDTGFYVRTLATNGTVPQCAMKVRISKDGGYFKPYTPSTTCNCAFQKAKNLRIATGTCAICTADTDCSGGLTCQNGYCE